MSGPRIENGKLVGALIAHGYCYTMIMIAQAKRALQGEMPPAYRLRFLEILDHTIDNWLRPEMIELIAPATDQECEIVREAAKLMSPGDRTGKWLDLLASKFDYFVQLNPSYLEAIRWAHARTNHRVGEWPEIGENPADVREGNPRSLTRDTEEIPERFHSWRPTAPRFARGSPSHPGGTTDPHTG